MKRKPAPRKTAAQKACDHIREHVVDWNREVTASSPYCCLCGWKFTKREIAEAAR